MAHDAKIKAVTDWVVGLDQLRDRVKTDAKSMAEAVPVEILGDPDALEIFLHEMLQELVAKHVMTADDKIRPEVTALIKNYVHGMMAE